jgi:hypothetical protein
MQCDSWNLSIQQDFTLNSKMEHGSWLGRLNPTAQGGIEGQRDLKWGRHLLRLTICRWADVWLRGLGLIRLNVFNASSYAIHDLSQRLRSKGSKSRKGM